MLEHQLEASEEKQKLLAEKSRHLEEAKVKLHGSLSSKEVALTSELEELRAKVGTDVSFAHYYTIYNVLVFSSTEWS